MKQYEKLGMDTEAALKWIEECKERKCLECVAYPTMINGSVSSACAAGYLLAEVPEPPKVPRWQTAKTQEDFDKLKDDFAALCKNTDECIYCKYAKFFVTYECYHAFLAELIEAEVEE